jgi:hypothetical protein
MHFAVVLKRKGPNVVSIAPDNTIGGGQSAGRAGSAAGG